MSTPPCNRQVIVKSNFEQVFFLVMLKIFPARNNIEDIDVKCLQFRNIQRYKLRPQGLRIINRKTELTSIVKTLLTILVSSVNNP